MLLYLSERCVLVEPKYIDMGFKRGCIPLLVSAEELEVGQRVRDLLQRCLVWREKDGAKSVCGDVSEYVCVCGGLLVVDDLTITGNFPTACTQRRPSEGKKDEKE